MAYSTILYDTADAVATITLNQPDRRNPISPATCGELAHALAAAQADDAVRAVVLTGAGKAFSAGGDLGKMTGGSETPPLSLVELLTRMHSCGLPIVARVNGHALAGGLGLMVACDLVIANDAATFGTTEIRLGLWPMMITAELTRNIGRKKTLELMLTGKRIDAAEAERIGLINRAVPAAELDAAVAELTDQLTRNSPATMTLGLRAFYDTQDMAHRAALEHLEGELAKVLALEDAAEGVRAFFEKREPNFKGR